MRAIFTTLLLSLLWFTSYAQPANDECFNAQFLSLSSPGNCPNPNPGVNMFSGNNSNATATTPYPSFTGCDGGPNDAPASEVWYTFTATGSVTTIEITAGFNNPNLILYQGNDCNELFPIDCASGVPLEAQTAPGESYLLAVSGASIQDQSNFNMTVTSETECDVCVSSSNANLSAFPGPDNGTYSPGQTVEFCLSITDYDHVSANWIHSVIVEFGDGWDLNSLVPLPPAGISTAGTWGWYDSFVGCTTGETYGPGFAYESGQGIGCGGTANDGNPGNNWGDSGIPTPGNPLVFCWQISVIESAPSGSDLSINAIISSDAETGSWGGSSCENDESPGFNFLGVVNDCNSTELNIDEFNVSCPGGFDGSFTVTSSGFFNYTVYDESGFPVDACNSCSSYTSSGLGVGTFSIVAEDVSTGCFQSVFANIFEDPFPTASAQQLNTPCPGSAANLQGDYQGGNGGFAQYEWTSPSGNIQTGQTTDAFEAGIWQLIVYTDGCPSDPVEVNVTYVDFFTNIIFDENEVCDGGSLTFSADSGASWVWTDLNTGQQLGTDQTLTQTFTQNTTIQLTSDDGTGCTDTDELDITVNPLPNISILSSGDGCPNTNLTIQAVGAGSNGTYEWTDNAFAPNPRTISGLPPGVYDYTAIGTDENGCSSMGSISVEILPLPMVELVPSSSTVCSGEEVTITAVSNDISSIFWFDNAGALNENPITINPTNSTVITADVTNSWGCIETFFVSIDVVDPPPPTNVVCGLATSNSIEFVWDAVPGADAYDIFIDGNGPQQVFNTTYTAMGYSPNTDVTITVQPIGANICPVTPTTLTCSTLSCPDLTLDINEVGPFCEDPNATVIDLTYTSSSNSGTVSWAGNGITNAADGTFNPVTAGLGNHEIILSYTEGPCTYLDTTYIAINPIPTADFTIGDTNLCTDATTTVSFAGSAGANATYNWNFDGGSATPGGTTQGPHQVSWSTPGTKTITLMVTENGCTSTMTSQTVSVSAPLASPVISCVDATSSSVTFSWPDINGATDYTVSVGANAPIMQTDTFVTVDMLMQNESVTISVTANTTNPCGATSATQTCSSSDCPAFTIDITAVPDICLDGTNSSITLAASASGGDGSGSITWSGLGVTGDQFDPVAAGAGSHDITATYTEDICSDSETITINVFDTPTADFTVDPGVVCIDQEVTITYTGSASAAATYNWNFNGGTAGPGTGEGPHTVSWATASDKTITLTVTENGCTSTLFSQTLSVEAPLAAPVINCSPTTSSIVFSWDAVTGAVDYTVSIISGPAGTNGTLDLNNLTYTVDGLDAADAVEIEVTAVGDGPCGNSSATQTCVAEDCPSVMITIDPVADICLDANAAAFDLSATVSGGNGGGTLTWSGTGITETTQGTFDPTTAGAGTWTITANYQEGNCPYNTSIDITVNPQPTADFTVDATVCTTDMAQVTYTGSASPSATYTWDFGPGTADPGTGPGPHMVSWTTGGTQTISLTVTENDCASEAFSQNIEVSEPLTSPVISCMSTTSSITFSWPAVAGATGYQVNVISGMAGVYDDAALTYTVTGLDAGDAVEIEVIAEGPDPCGNSSTTQTCVAEDCPMATVTIDPVAEICLNANAAAFDLTATVSGGNGGGTLSWSGTGITDETNGTFNPATAGAGTSTITATYVEGNCPYNATIDIVVNPQPTADFSVNAAICTTDMATVTYTGSANPSATYDWDFGTGIADPGTGPGPHTVSWTNGGTQTIGLTVTENDCASEPFTQNVEVSEPLAAPVISCMTTTSSITFSWPAVAGATGYQVNLLSGTAGVYDDATLTYSVTGLDAGDAVEIEVVAESGGPCGTSSATQECVAEDCPMVTITIDAVDPVCLDSNASTIDLNVMITGGTGGGTETWSGPGITDANQGLFDPNDSGAGSFDITLAYTEGNCSYSEMLTIVVNPQPSATFTTDLDLACVDQEITLSYTGGADPGATYEWDIPEATILSGSTNGPGPITISYGTPGTQSAFLTVTENGCASDTETVSLEITAPLTEPVISCDSDNTSILFSWDAVAGATGYSVDDIDVPAGASTTFDEANLTYTVSNLIPSDVVTIQVNIETDSPCGGISTQATCNAQDCEELSFAEITYGPFCADEDVQFLQGMIMGSDGSGTFAWSGPGITDAAGTFDPADAGAGNHSIQLSFTENACTYDTTYTIEVLAIPVASFTLDAQICSEDEATLTPDPNISATATYNWDLDGALLTGGTDPGPYTVSWDTPGAYTVSLFLEDQGCVSTTFTQTITVDPVVEPVVINCQETSATSVTFSWNDVTGADGYDVVVLQGPSGTQDGNTYTMDGLTPGEVVEIEVTANTSSLCGASVATGQCVAEDCQPLTLALSGPDLVCTGSDADISFDFTTTQPGPFTVTYTLNGGEEQMVTVADGESILLPALADATDLEIISIIDSTIPDCAYTSDAAWTVNVDQNVTAGESIVTPDFCEDQNAFFDLDSALSGQDSGGAWTEVSSTPSSPGAFNPDGSFNPAGQEAGTYTFQYTVAGGACPDASANVEVIVNPLPIADAGLDQTLTCNMGSVVLGGNGTTGGDVTYVWTASDTEVIITDPSLSLIDVSAPSTYTLEVTDANGCVGTDQVLVDANFDVPVGEISISEISCFEANDGSISINNVTGGTPPYTYIFNGEPTTNNFFSNLGGAEYTLIIQDASECFTEVFVDLQEPEQVAVELITNLENNGNTIQLGESVTLEAVFNPNINLDTIMWEPDSLNRLSNTAVEVSPLETTSFSVTIVDENGCSDSDDATIIVEKLRPVYIPNAFSPDEDGINDILMIQGGNDIQIVKSFLVYNRWGESVFEAYNFQPNDPAFGWGGQYRGQPMNAAVFVYFVEVEFVDGEVVIYKGDVILMH